jgi:hypothetical protein
MRWQRGREAVEVFPGLGFDTGERVAFRFGLDNADRFAVGLEHVVGFAGAQRKLPHGDAEGCGDVDPSVVLHLPASLRKLAVDVLSGFLLRSPAAATGESEGVP